jgi:hypothetical protein
MMCLQPIALILITAFVPRAAANIRVKRIVGGRPAAVPSEDDPIVFVYLNDHGAKVYGTKDIPDGYYNFRGIRYAEPPVGRFRFQVRNCIIKYFRRVVLFSCMKSHKMC